MKGSGRHDELDELAVVEERGRTRVRLMSFQRRMGTMKSGMPM